MRTGRVCSTTANVCVKNLDRSNSQLYHLSFLLILLVVSSLAAVAIHGSRDEGNMAPELRTLDRYEVIMWSTGKAHDTALWFQRLREMGCTGEECYRGNDPTPFVQHGMSFYAENLVPQLAYLHSRRKLYDEDFEGYTRTHDKRFLERTPCFHDPGFWEAVKDSLQRLARPYVAHQPLFYNLQDELSIGSFASPMDYCFGEHTLEAFRTWLQGRYESLDALNEEWETDFGTWGVVTPMTTYEIKQREREALENGCLENYAPWADHREFMDRTFALTLDRLRGFIRELDLATPVGIEGTQMPSCWGGYDLWQLSQVIDWIEPYDVASSREIFRSFLPASAPIVGTVFGDDFPRLRRKLWWLALHGDRGCIIWDDEKSRCIEKTQEAMPITGRGRGLAPIFAEIKQIAPILFDLERVDDRIAIHYSQASIRAHWMFESRQDGDTWPRRFSSYESKHSLYARVRDSFVRVVEDLGLQYNFVSYEQIEHGELLDAGYKVLLLPQSVAMSARECEQVEAFVRAGGTVIADNMTATMDEHCRRLPEGQLDALFGICRENVGWQAEASAGTIVSYDGYEPFRLSEAGTVVTTAAGASSVRPAAMVENYVGRGCARYLNLEMLDYGKLRLTSPREMPIGSTSFECLPRAAFQPR